MMLIQQLIKLKFDKRTAKNIGWLFFIQILTYLFPVFITPLTISKIGIENYGYFSLAFAICIYAQIIIDYGFNVSSLREVVLHSQDYPYLRRIFFETTYIKIVIGAVLFLVILLARIVLPSSMLLLNTIKVLFFNFFSNALFPVWFYQGVNKLAFVSVLNFISKAILFLLIFFLMQQNSNATDVAFYYSFSQILITAFVLFYTAIKYDWKPLPLKQCRFKKGIKDAFPFFSSTISMSILGSVNILIVGFFFNGVVVGYFAAADRLIQGLRSLYSPVTRAIFPATIEKFTSSSRDGYQYLLKVSKVFTPMICFLCFGCFLFADKIAVLFIKTENELFINTLRLLLIIPVLTFNGSLYSVNGLSSIKKEKFQAIMFGFMTPIYILLQVVSAGLGIYMIAVNAILIELVVLILSLRVVKNFCTNQKLMYA